MKKALAVIMIALGCLLGVPGVIACLTIVGLVFGVPMVCTGAVLVVLGIKLWKHEHVLA